MFALGAIFGAITIIIVTLWLSRNGKEDDDTDL